MVKRTVGDRVGVVSHQKDDKVFLLGFGVYQGETIPGEEAGGIGVDLRKMEIPNPEIKLDSGKSVWGCECWWGSEGAVKESIKGKEIVAVDLDKWRAAHKEVT